MMKELFYINSYRK